MHRRFEAMRYLGEQPEPVRCVRRFDSRPDGSVESTAWVQGRVVFRAVLSAAVAEHQLGELDGWTETT